MKSNNRIVGGYNTQENKPWAARIWFEPYNFLCGGSLINKRYILTAAHCICEPQRQLHCDKNGPLYNTTTMYSVYLGVNNMEVDNDNLGLKGDPYYSYGVESARALSWRGFDSSKLYKDIGLLRLDRDAVFVKNILQPICLPLKSDNSDVVNRADFEAGNGLQVYVSGWGRLFSACVTDELGPVRGMKCKHPYFYRGNQLSGCTRQRTPSAKDRDCKDFRQKNRKAYPKTPGDSIKIVTGNVTKTCYSIKKGGNGWCKTESQAGPQDRVDDSQWGWYVHVPQTYLYFTSPKNFFIERCECHCRYRSGTKSREKAILATRLQETKLDLLPPQHCSWMTRVGNYSFRGKWEMCAGKKKMFHSVRTYVKEGKNYRLTASKQDMMGLSGPRGSEYPFSYYIYGTDSCSGDSGGGLYTWRDGKPTLLGVISRGFG